MEVTFSPVSPFDAPSGITRFGLSEPGRVLCWRIEQLAQAGYSDEASVALAMRDGVDLHRATDLLLHGCPEQTALRILI